MRLAAGALLGVLCLAWMSWQLWPLPIELQHHLAPAATDAVLTLTFIQWGADSVASGLSGFWSPPYFYPTRGAAALSDHLLGLGVLAFLGERLLGLTGIACANLFLLLSFPLLAASTFWLVSRAGSAPVWAAALAAGALALSPYRIEQLVHLQVLWAPTIPLTIVLFHRLLARPRWSRAGWFLLAYVASLSFGSYLAYWLHLPLLAVAGVRLRWHRRRLLGRRPVAVLATTALVACAAVATFFGPYAKVLGSLELERSGGELHRLSARPALYLSIGRDLRAASLWPRRWRAEIDGALFPGLALALGALAFWLAAGLDRRRTPAAALPPDRKEGRAARVARAGGAGLVVAGYLLAMAERGGAVRLPGLDAGSLGGRLGEAPLGFLLVALGLALLLPALRLPRAGRSPSLRLALWTTGGVAFLLSHAAFLGPLRGVVPGVSGMRVPTRLHLFVLLALAVAAADGLARLAARGRAWRLLVPVATVALIFWESSLPAFGADRLLELPASIEEAPAVYRWLASRDDVAGYAEIPFRQGNANALRMYYAVLAGKPVANGHSGYLAPTYLFLRSRCRGWPPLTPRCLEAARKLGVSHLVVHDRPPGGEERAVPASAAERLEAVTPAAAGSPLRVAYADRTTLVVEVGTE